MKTKIANKAGHRTHRAFTLNPVATGCAVFISALATSAYAQEAAPTTAQDTTPTATQNQKVSDQSAPQTVTVAGIRRGIENAIAVKKDSTSIVEVISAEDIGKLPDASIAESIARLPGLAGQRVAGRAQAISIRGLSPDFATTTLNGREQVSTGDTRSAEFDQYPSELFGAVVVYKTPDAALVDQGLSGTIDMQTFNPLAFPGRSVTISARGEKNSLGPVANSSDKGNRLSFNYIDQFANRTIGVQLGFAHLESPLNDHETGLYEPWYQGQFPGVPANTYLMNGIKSLATSGTTKRDGFVGTLEYKPSQNFTSKLDVFASTFHEVKTFNQFEFNLGNYNGGNTPGLNYDVANITNGTLTGGTASGVYPLVRGEYNNRKDSIQSVGWGNTFKFDGGWKLLADLNYSHAKRDELYNEINTQLLNASGGAMLDTMNVNWATGGFPTLSGKLNYSDPTQLNLRNTIYGSGYGRLPHVEDTLSGFKLAATAPAPSYLEAYVADIDFGVNYTTRTKKKRQPEAAENLIGNNAVISSDLLYAPVDLGFAGSGVIPSFNVPGIIAKYYQPWTPSPIDQGAVQRAWDVSEDITTSYLKANLDHQFSSSVTMRGNLGLQIQNTKQSSTSVYNDTVNNVLVPVTDGKSYTDVLPQLNLVFELPDDQIVRFALAKQVARPRIDQMRASFDFHVDTATRLPNANGGNPKLDPWRANAIDISWEKYFAKKAYVSAAIYYKKLNSYIYDQSNVVDFSKYTAGTGAVSNYGLYSSEYNGQGGTLKGAELSASLPLSLLTRSLDGFGVLASTSYNDSAITIKSATFDVGSSIPLPGMSKHVTSLTAYYEKNGFSARISQRRRSEFVGDIENFAGDRNLRFIAPENITDVQLEYTFQTGTYKDLGLFLQVGNLTDAAYSTYQGTTDHPLEYAKYGRTMLAGVNYKF